MYLYFDKKGVLKTQIDHGEKARQGSNLSVNVCLDEDFFTNLCNIYGYSNTYKNYLNWTMSVSVQGPNGSITNTEPTLESTITPFFKSFDNEVTYDLIPDTNYITYSCSIPSNQSTNYGVGLNLIFTLTAATTGYKYRLAAVKVDVEKTIGRVHTTITQNQYNQLMSEIEGIAADYIIDSEPSENGLHAVSSGGVYEALSLKQDNIDETNQLSSDVVNDTNASHKFVSQSDITRWNSLETNVQSNWNASSGAAVILNKPNLATVATSGSYNDLSNKPTIGNAALTIQKNGSTIDTFAANATTNKTINITVPVNANDVNALPASTKYGSKIDMSINNTNYKITLALKDQNNDTLNTATIDLPLESVVINGSYNSNTKKVILTLQSGSTIEFSVADLISGLQAEITSNNKLSSDLIDDTNHTNKFVKATDISNWNSKQDAIIAGPGIKINNHVVSIDTASPLGLGGVKLGFISEYNDNKQTAVKIDNNNRAYVDIQEAIVPQRFSMVYNLVVNMNQEQFAGGSWTGDNTSDIRTFQVNGLNATMLQAQRLIEFLTGDNTLNHYNATKPTPCFVFCTQSNLWWNLQWDDGNATLRAYKTVNTPFEDRRIVSLVPHDADQKINILNFSAEPWQTLFTGAYKYRARHLGSDQIFFDNKIFYDLVKNRNISFEIPVHIEGDLVLPDSTTTTIEQDADVIFDYCGKFTEGDDEYYQYVGTKMILLGVCVWEGKIYLNINKENLTWSTPSWYGTLQTNTIFVLEGELIILD